MCRLFGRTQSVIAMHIMNVFKEGEFSKEGFMQFCTKPLQGEAGPLEGRIEGAGLLAV